jgi:hypothetical protein
VLLPEGFAEVVRRAEAKALEKSKAMLLDAKNGLQREGCPSGCYDPIPPGSRNNTLNSWGFGLAVNDWPNWEAHIYHRGRLSGVSEAEIEQITRSIENAI